MKCRWGFISMRKLVLVGCAALLMLSPAAPRAVNAAPIYVFKEADGSIRFTNKPPPSGVQAKVFTADNSKFFTYRGKGFSWQYGARLRWNGKLFEKQYREMIENVADRHGLDAALVKAVIHCESGFNPHAVSPKGARGLMQLMPSRALLLGVSDSFSPNQNVEGGSRHLAFLLQKYKGNLKFALAAYNAGEEAVEKYGGIPPYKETQGYVQRVMHMMDRYKLAAQKSSLKRSKA